MPPASRLVELAIVLVSLAAIDAGFLFVSYGVLRLIHISVNWTTWLVGSLIIAASAYTCLLVFLPATPVRGSGLSNVVGAFSFLVAIHAANQWTTRRWYIVVKKGAARWLAGPIREVLLFLRRHHQFLGWLVVITAEAHTFYFLQDLTRFPAFKIITGFIALAILLAMAFIGLLIEYAVRHKRVSQKIRIVHSLLAIAFFAAFVAHVS